MSQLHRFSRTELLVGTAGLERLKGAHVALFGLGGVGSYAAEALCRSGIGAITIVDFDDICLTNLNRQLHATSDTVGKAKSAVMAERMRRINPDAEIRPFKAFYNAESCGELLLDNGYDYVLDAIDHITAKLHLLATCRELGIPVIASMGAAGKLDPTKVHVDDISKTHSCRMARDVRKLLRKRGVVSGIKTVYSTEEARIDHANQGGCKSDCICPNKDEQQFSCEHRRVILGSSAHIPAIFGLTMAGVVVNDLLAGAGS